MNGQPPRAVAWLLGLLDAVGAGPVGKLPPATVRQCPAHADSSPSLSIGAGEKGQVLIKCHAGCSWEEILSALTIPACYLFTPPPVDPAAYARAFIRLTFPPLTFRAGHSPQASGYRLAAIHDYGPAHRVLRHRKGSSKTMEWETFRDGSWLPGLFGVPTSALPLYREPDVRKAVALGEPVLLVESESSVDAISGHYATTWAGGATSVKTGRLTEVLGDYPHLIVVPDNDPPGLAALATLTAHGLAPHVLMPSPGEDARDLLTTVGLDRFAELVGRTVRGRDLHKQVGPTGPTDAVGPPHMHGPTGDTTAPETTDPTSASGASSTHAAYLLSARRPTEERQRTHTHTPPHARPTPR